MTGSDIVPGPVAGPCSAWVTSAEVAACRDDDIASDPTVFDDAAVEASMLLFELSGRQFPGVCERTVRPCRVACSSWLQGVDFGAAWEVGGYWGYSGGRLCGCQAVSRVKLSGYPVREITEVLIDGEVVDPATYRLDNWRWLTRLGYQDGGVFRARRWPTCQNLALNDDQPGTFSVSYLYGADPPPLGVQAAAALASEIYNACGGSSDCALPSGVVEIVRQGITVRRVHSAAEALWKGASGITLVDQFLASVNPTGKRRRGAIYSPDVSPYPRTVGS